MTTYSFTNIHIVPYKPNYYNGPSDGGSSDTVLNAQQDISSTKNAINTSTGHLG